MSDGLIEAPEATEAPEPIDAFDLMMMDDSSDEPSFPLNRIVAFLGPYISLLAGLITIWLMTHVEIFTILGAKNEDVLQSVTELLVFIVVSGLTWLGQRKWLQGHQNWEAGQLEIQKAAVAGYAASQPQIEAPPRDEKYDEKAAKEEMLKRMNDEGRL